MLLSKHAFCKRTGWRKPSTVRLLRVMRFALFSDSPTQVSATTQGRTNDRHLYRMNARAATGADTIADLGGPVMVDSP